MVGVVGSSPIAPTNILQITKNNWGQIKINLTVNFDLTPFVLTPFVLTPSVSVGIARVGAVQDSHVGFKVKPLSFTSGVAI